MDTGAVGVGPFVRDLVSPTRNEGVPTSSEKPGACSIASVPASERAHARTRKGLDLPFRTRTRGSRPARTREKGSTSSFVGGEWGSPRVLLFCAVVVGACFLLLLLFSGNLRGLEDPSIVTYLESGPDATNARAQAREQIKQMSDLRDYRDQALAYLKRVKTSVKQYALNLTDLEVKVEEATNNEPWGPHGKLMHEICGCAWRDNESYRQIMGVLARRLEDKDQNWRHVYKSLLLLEHLIKNGPPKLIDELRANLDVIQRLKFFEYVDKKGKDHGLNVRNRAQLLVSLLQDDETIRMERSKARANAAKYGGVSSDQMRFSNRNHSFEDSYHGMSQGSASFNSAPAYDRPHDPTAPYSRWASSSYSASKFEDAPAMEVEGQTERYAQQEDPVEMTRARIEKMKMDGQFEEQPQDIHDDVTRKRLSNTKIKPEISQTFSSIKVAPAAERRDPMPPVALHSTQQAEVNLLDLDSPVERPSTSNEIDPFAQLAAKAVQNECITEPSKIEEEDDEDFFQSMPPLSQETLGVDADDGFGAFTVAGKGGSTPSPRRVGSPKPASTRQPIDLDDLLGAQGTTRQPNTSASPGVVQYPPGGAGNMGQFNQTPGMSAPESPLKALGLPESGSSPIHFERDHKLGSSPSKDPFAGIAGI